MTVRPGFVRDLWTDGDQVIDGELSDSLLGEIDPAGDDAGSPSPSLDNTRRIELSPTVGQFVRSEADVAIIYGARGEGKTVAGVARILRIAQQNVSAWPVKVAVIRDTWVNLKRTVFETLYQGVRYGWWDAEFHSGDIECVLDGGVAHLYFFGMDRAADANKFQGFEAGVLWLEEPAPAADMSSGIPAEVFAMGVSSLRQPGMRKTYTQITMNPPDRSHWTLELAETIEEAGNPHMVCEVLRIPTGENAHLPTGYRERMRLGLEDAQRPDMIRRLSEGNIGTVIVGFPVTPEFSDMHVSKKPIAIRLGWPTYRAYDAGLNPTCLHAQTTPAGQLNIVGCVVGMNMGMEELLEVHVIPWEARMNLRTIGTIPAKRTRDDYGHVKAWSKARSMVKVRDIGDPACVQREQTHSERSVARIIENLLGTTFEKGRVELSARKNSMRAVLTRNIGGRPMLQIDPECVPLIEALEGAWHHMKFPSGKYSEMPIKDLACVDARTEMLTLDGFKSVDTLVRGQRVWAYDTVQRCLIPDRLVEIHRDDGRHRLLTWKSRSLSIAVTPNHRMVVSRGWFGGGRGVGVRWGPLHFRRADAITDSTMAVPGVHGGPPRGRRVYSDDFLRLCAWVMTEGTYRKDGTGEIWIVQSAGHVAYVDQLGKLIAHWPSEARMRWDGSRHVVVVRHELAALIRHLLPDKVPSPSFIQGLRRADGRLFLFEALKGDGSHRAGSLPWIEAPSTIEEFWRPFAGKAGTPVLCCASETEADSVAYIAILAGIRPRRRFGDTHHSDHRVAFLRWPEHGGLATARRGEVEVESIWCPQTERGTWVARREGRVWVTGNSHPG